MNKMTNNEELSSSEIPNSSDTIYRQDAIDSLRMDVDIIPFAKAREYVRATIETIGNRLEQLPSAQQEPRSPLYYGDGYSEGKMVYDSAECPNCGYIYDEGDQVWGEPYCPHCGQALDWYMRDEQND